MVNFNPNVYYSDEASKAQERYRNAKKETESFSQHDQTTTATLILDHFDSEENKRLKDLLTCTRKQDDTLSIDEHTAYANALKSYQTSLPTALYNIIKEQPTFTVDLLKLPDYFTSICPNARLITIYGTPYLVSANCLTINQTNELMTVDASSLQVKQTHLKEDLDAVENFTEASLQKDLENINALKAQMEAQIKALYEKQALKQAELQEKIAKYEHDLFIMRTDLTAYEYRQGLGVNVTPIHTGQLAPQEQPLVLYQKLIFLDEDLPRFKNLYDIDSPSLETALKTSDALLDHLCPTTKGITFLKQRNSQGSYELNNTVMRFIQNNMPNHIGILIRNGENVWLGWLDDKDIKLNDDSFNSKASQETLTIDLLKSRHYLNNILLGFLERGDYLQLDHTVTNLFNDPGIIFSNADNQLTDTTYITLSELLDKLNQYNSPNDPIYLFNSIRDSRTNRGYGTDTYRGRGENGLSDGAIVHEGYHHINGIDVMNDLKEHSYVQAKKYPWSTNKVNLYIESDEYINLKFLTSDLIDYYIQSKRIGNLSNTGRYVDYVHMLPILFKIKDILIKQEKEDRLYIPAKDYDLNLLTTFKITHNVRNITTFQAKRYSKWLTALSEKDRQNYEQLLLINNLDAYVPKKDCYILYYKEYKKKYRSISSVTKKDMDEYDKDKDEFLTYHYVETVITPYVNPFDRLKTFSSLKKAQDFLKNEPIYLYNDNAPSWEIANLNDPNTITDFKTFLRR